MTLTTPAHAPTPRPALELITWTPDPCPPWCDQQHGPLVNDPYSNDCGVIHRRVLATVPCEAPGWSRQMHIAIQAESFEGSPAFGEPSPGEPEGPTPVQLWLLIGDDRGRYDDGVVVALPQLLALLDGVKAALAVEGLEHLAYAATIDAATRAALAGPAPAPATAPATPPPTATLEEYRLRLVAEGYTAETVKAKLSAVHAFATHAGVDPLELTSAHVLAYLTAREYAPWTRRKYLEHIGAWARFAGILDPGAGIRHPASPRGLPRPISTAQLEQLITAAKGRDLVFVLLGAYAGLRAHETAKVALEDIEPQGEDGAWRLRVLGKGNKAAVIPCPQRLAEALAEYATTKGINSGRLFPRATSASVQRAIPALGRKVGLTITSHQLRHWYGTAAHAASGDLLMTQQLMRHASPATTAGYAAVTGGRTGEVVSSMPGATRQAVEVVSAISIPGTAPATSAAANGSTKTSRQDISQAHDAAARTDEPSLVRAWARSQAITVPSRGRYLPAAVVQAWRDAGSPTQISHHGQES